MRNPPDVPELREDTPARRVDGVGHALPAGDLLRAENAGRAWIALAFLGDLCALGDDQPSAGALRIIGGGDRSWYFASTGAIARHRRHHDPVG